MADRVWICSNPNHRGIRAPGRMRADDIRRFCIPCSTETGYLVERHSPALERKRTEAKTKRQEREQARREQARERWLVTLKDATGRERKLDVRAELRRALTDMGYFDGWARGQKPTIADFNITIRRGQKHTHSGRARIAGFDVWFTFGANASYEDGLHLIYHEAAHLASSIGATPHGERFHRLLAHGLQERWPWIVYGSVAPRQRGGCFEMGRRIVKQMEQRTRDGGTV